MASRPGTRGRGRGVCSEGGWGLGGVPELCRCRGTSGHIGQEQPSVFQGTSRGHTPGRAHSRPRPRSHATGSPSWAGQAGPAPGGHAVQRGGSAAGVTAGGEGGRGAGCTSAGARSRAGQSPRPCSVRLPFPELGRPPQPLDTDSRHAGPAETSIRLPVVLGDGDSAHRPLRGLRAAPGAGQGAVHGGPWQDGRPSARGCHARAGAPLPPPPARLALVPLTRGVASRSTIRVGSGGSSSLVWCGRRLRARREGPLLPASSTAVPSRAPWSCLCGALSLQSCLQRPGRGPQHQGRAACALARARVPGGWSLGPERHAGAG